MGNERSTIKSGWARLRFSPITEKTPTAGKRDSFTFRLALRTVKPLANGKNVLGRVGGGYMVRCPFDSRRQQLERHG